MRVEGGEGFVTGQNKLQFVNFSQLRSFYAVARELSFTKAAELLTSASRR